MLTELQGFDELDDIAPPLNDYGTPDEYGFGNGLSEEFGMNNPVYRNGYGREENNGDGIGEQHSCTNAL